MSFVLLLDSRRLLTMFELHLCVSMWFVPKPFTWSLCPVSVSPASAGALKYPECRCLLYLTDVLPSISY